MTILELQRRYRELGRLRTGEQAETPAGKRYPKRLEHWRLTSPSRELLEVASGLYGGTVEPWSEAPSEAAQFELVTERSELDVIVPLQDLAGSQYLELWSGGGVKRRCDGTTELVSGKPCLCDPAARECSPTTHLLVLLPEIPDVGVWRHVTRSWHAAAELSGTVELLGRIAARGAMPKAVLRIEARTKRVQGQTRHYVVPVLEVAWSLAQAEREGIPALAAVPALPADPVRDDRTRWGPEPELQTSDAKPGRASPSVGRIAAERVDDAAAPPASPGSDSPPPERSAASNGAPRGSSLAEAFGEGANAAPDPWGAYHAAYEAADDEGRAAVRKAAVTGRMGWPPDEGWPADRLGALLEVLRGSPVEEVLQRGGED